MWEYRQSGFNRNEIALNGNRFLLGNGYLGYRGTMEEFTADEQVGCMLNGLYDRVGNQWREPVNAPNGLFTRISCDGKTLALPGTKATDHEQELDFRHGVHRRTTVFVRNGNEITIAAERFVSHADPHLICMKYQVRCSKPANLVIQTGIDAQVWDIAGPHLEQIELNSLGDLNTFQALTHENGIRVAAAEAVAFSGPIEAADRSGLSLLRRIAIKAEPGRDYVFHKYFTIYTGLDVAEPAAAAQESCRRAVLAGYDRLRQENDAVWENHWSHFEAGIEGDDEADFALRYSIYHLLILAPRHSDRVSIPARGVSGQVYKGAVFWDTEMFMLPVFSLTMPEVARNLIMYRYHTLDGARRKAREYGYEGAFFAWESQETGDDACSLFNVTDVFTNRPMRTYFRDKQIHVSADVVLAIRNYCRQTGDYSILTEGAAEILVECARFFYSYAYFKPNKKRYEILDVVGPDEYHERVNNNAFTSKMVAETMRCAEEFLRMLADTRPEFYAMLEQKLHFAGELSEWRTMREQLYVPSPDPETNLIEQFDGYYCLEDVSLAELKSRRLDPTEYLGGGNGLATSTRILKQADVVLMLNLFREEYSKKTIQANWEYYEPRTEHGSSLSACAYSMTAAYLGRPDWAYDFFMKTATIDITGKSKQFIGPQYIGGTHPAANGGAWLSLVFGFAGLSVTEKSVSLSPSLPSKWSAITFGMKLKGHAYRLRITREGAEIVSLSPGRPTTAFLIDGRTVEVIPFHNERQEK